MSDPAKTGTTNGRAALDYVTFDPAPFDFPRPQLPILAPFRWNVLGRRESTQRAIPCWTKSARFYGRARYALRDAFRLSGVGPEGSMLAPAYHCRTMLDPALALGAPVLLYAVDRELRPDLDDISHQLSCADPPVRAVVATHFFGMAYDFRPLAALCASRRVRLIEDCAQSLPLTTPSNGMGVTGSWCVASPYKFFPCEDGGVLWSGSTAEPMDLPPLRAPSLRSELSQMHAMWRHARIRLPRNPSFVTPHDERAPSSRELEAQTVRRHLAGPSRDYVREHEEVGCSTISRWIIERSDISAILEARRANYRRWVRIAEGLPHAKALRAELTPQDTPYMFPLWIDEPERRFPSLKRLGFPIYRWDSLASSACATAADYRLHLLHLPCHQALTGKEMDWMEKALHQVFGEGS